MHKVPGQQSFEAYNNAGANPGTAWDGKDVPLWNDLPDNVQAKWAAAEKAAGRLRLAEFPGHDLGREQVADAFARAHERYERECVAHNAPLQMRVLLECFEDELIKQMA
jgi:hypothetical protein